MRRKSPVRYCRCETRLARDNPSPLCAACQAKARDLALGPPAVPAEFWSTDRMRDALADWHMGRVVAAFRTHPFHGRAIRQEIAARWVGITQAQLSRIENGPAIKNLDKLIYWARVLRIPAHLLWFKLPEHRELPGSPEVVRPCFACTVSAAQRSPRASGRDIRLTEPTSGGSVGSVIRS